MVQDRFQKIIDSYRGRKIAVVGDLILDEYVWGKVSRISPEAPVPVVEVQRESLCLGGAANVASNLVSLGAEPLISGVVGGDSSGEKVLTLLKEAGIRDSGVIVDPTRKTTVKTRVIAHHQQVCRTDREYRVPLGMEVRKGLLDIARERIDLSDAVILSDYGKGVLDAGVAQDLLGYTKERGRFTAIDPKVNDLARYRGASLITPNKNEAERVSGIEIVDAGTLKEAGCRIVDATSVESLLITQGEEGMTLFEGHDTRHIPTAAKEVFDVTGAGDTVIAVLTLSVAAGGSVYEAAVLANQAAGLVVGKLGTASVDTDELRGAIRSALSVDENGRG